MTPPIESIANVYDRHRELRGRLAGIITRRLDAADLYHAGIFTYGDLERDYRQITIDEYSIHEAIAECERWML